MCFPHMKHQLISVPQILCAAVCQADGTENETGQLLHSDRQTQIFWVHARASAHVAVAAYPALMH